MTAGRTSWATCSRSGTRVHMRGIVQNTHFKRCFSSQGGAPSPFDRNFSTKIAAKAIQWISQKLGDCYKGGEQSRRGLFAGCRCSGSSPMLLCVQDECLPTRTTRRVCWGCAAEPWCSSPCRSSGTKLTLCKKPFLFVHLPRKNQINRHSFFSARVIATVR